MEDALKQINAVAGAMGSMVYDDHGQLIFHLFPKIFDKSMLDGAVKTVSDNLPGLQDITGGVKMIDLRFQGGRIVVRPVEGGCLVLLCEGTINLQSLTIALNLVIKKIEKGLKELPVATQQTPVASAPVAPPASPRELIEKGPLSGDLQGMQTHLAKFMGPMAKIIFLECVEKWLQTNQPVKASLPQLVDIVVAEIGDQASMTEYRQKISTFMN